MVVGVIPAALLRLARWPVLPGRKRFVTSALVAALQIVERGAATGADIETPTVETLEAHSSMRGPVVKQVVMDLDFFLDMVGSNPRHVSAVVAFVLFSTYFLAFFVLRSTTATGKKRRTIASTIRKAGGTSRHRDSPQKKAGQFSVACQRVGKPYVTDELYLSASEQARNGHTLSTVVASDE
eukprot:TRINITY_DN64016_c0_g1_i1.p1 TRINITY_DN64016_c0_g1~~TRINITY_DN64016_c0_g1_i1.p1  ORF type:complete len:182 (+),score=31.13 TRINITY_DN64016_c0_g1_i1:130-675(+)